MSQTLARAGSESRTVLWSKVSCLPPIPVFLDSSNCPVVCGQELEYSTVTKLTTANVRSAIRSDHKICIYIPRAKVRTQVFAHGGNVSYVTSVLEIVERPSCAKLPAPTFKCPCLQLAASFEGRLKFSNKASPHPYYRSMESAWMFSSRVRT